MWLSNRINNTVFSETLVHTIGTGSTIAKWNISHCFSFVFELFQLGPSPNSFCGKNDHHQTVKTYAVFSRSCNFHGLILTQKSQTPFTISKFKLVHRYPHCALKIQSSSRTFHVFGITLIGSSLLVYHLQLNILPFLPGIWS